MGSGLVAADAGDGVTARRGAGASVDAEPPVARSVGQGEGDGAVALHVRREAGVVRRDGECGRRDLVAAAAVGVGPDIVLRSDLIAADAGDAVAGNRRAGSPPVDLEPPVAGVVGDGEVDRLFEVVDRGRQAGADGEVDVVAGSVLLRVDLGCVL